MTRLTAATICMIVCLVGVGCSNSTMPLIGTAPDHQAPMDPDLSPTATANSEFDGLIVVYPIEKGGATDAGAPYFLVSKTHAWVIPQADRPRFVNLGVGTIINCPRKVREHWTRVSVLYGEPAEKKLVEHLSPNAKPNDDDVRVCNVSAGPLTVGDVTGYEGRLVLGQELQPTKLELGMPLPGTGGEFAAN